MNTKWFSSRLKSIRTLLRRIDFVKMQSAISTTLLLTVLLAIGLVFFLRAASKDRTTVLDLHSPLAELDLLNGIILWLEGRGWHPQGGDADRQVLKFQGTVSSSQGLAVFLSILGALGASCLGLVIRQLYPILGWWPLLLALVGGPMAGLIYRKRSSRIEYLELRLLESSNDEGSTIRLRAHRDELIAMEIELSKNLKLVSDGSLLSSPI